MKLNISSIKDFQRCEKLAYYRYDLGRTRKRQYSQPLDVGTIWHKGMEAYMLRDNMDEMGDIMIDHLAQLTDREYHEKAAEQLSILQAGLAVWQKPVDWQVFSVEAVLDAPLPRWRVGGPYPSDHILQGRLDAIVKWNEQWWHVQHKTIDAAKPIPVYWQQMERDWHECGYAYLLARNGFTPVGGTLLITARKVSRKQATLNPHQIITHQFLTRPQAVVDKAVDDIHHIMDRWQANRDSARTTGGPSFYIENRDHCTGPYGNRACPYMDVCNGLVNIEDDTLFEPTQSTYE